MGILSLVNYIARLIQGIGVVVFLVGAGLIMMLCFSSETVNYAFYYVVAVGFGIFVFGFIIRQITQEKPIAEVVE